MQILSDYSYIISKLKRGLHVIVVLLLINKAPAINKTLGMILEATQAPAINKTLGMILEAIQATAINKTLGMILEATQI